MTPIQAEKKINRAIIIIKANAMSRVRKIVDNPANLDWYDPETPSERKLWDIESIMRDMNHQINAVKAKYQKRIYTPKEV